MYGFVIFLIIISFAYWFYFYSPKFKQIQKDILLVDSCEYYSLNVIKDMISNGANVNGFDEENRTPLTVAVEHKRLDIVEMLLHEGANVNMAGHMKQTPLIIAVDNEDYEMVKYLLSKGANTHYKDNFGFDSLMIAESKGYKDIVNLLLNNGAKPSKDSISMRLLGCSIFGTIEDFKKLINEGADINAQDRDGNTPLILSALNGRIDIVKYLISIEADILKTNKSGYDAIGYMSPDYANEHYDNIHNILVEYRSKRLKVG